jgi:hypothetical protein
MADLFGVRIAAATIAQISRSCAARLQDFVAAVRDRVAAAAVKHMDETGFRIGGKTRWVHIAATAWLTFYRTCARRGSLLANVVGTVVHDHWKKQATCRRILDLAHGYGARTVVVGVETQANFLTVREMGSNLVQGFLFGKPMTAKKFAQTCASVLARLRCAFGQRLGERFRVGGNHGARAPQVVGKERHWRCAGAGPVAGFVGIEAGVVSGVGVARR